MGNEAHAFIQVHFRNTGETEVPVFGTPNTITGKGKIDILLKDPEGWEVYEIKPYSDYYIGLGKLQRYGYLMALSNDPQNPIINENGTTYNPNGVSFPSVVRPGYDIKYYTFDDSPGMIYYKYEKQKKEVPQESAQAIAMLLLMAAMLLILDNATGVGVLDDPLAAMLIYKAAELLRQ